MVTWERFIVRFIATIFCCWGFFSAQESWAEQPLKRFFYSATNTQEHKVLQQNLFYPTELQEFYLAHNYQPVWYPPYRLDNAQQLLIQFIGQIEQDGLNPQDYHYAVLLENCQWPFKSELFSPCDILLSDAFLLLSQHLLVGKLDPNQLFDKTALSKAKLDSTALLQQALIASDFAVFLNNFQPQQLQYQQLKRQLALLRDKPFPLWEPLRAKPTIKLNDTDLRLLSISQRLLYWGDLRSPTLELHYAIKLEQAVRRFQKRHGLEEDGKIGKATIAALNVNPQQRIRQLILNMERLRWQAELSDRRYILVNVPSFEMKAIEGGKVAFKKPVIVGKIERQTPIFSDEVRYLTFNPTWTVPLKLATEDKLPLLKKDPSYIRRMNIQVFTNYSQPVDAQTIDWRQLSKNHFPYQLVQAPGPKNALGQVKFMFPNQYEVYLHDTPAKELFKKNSRALSSGCIRVFQPLELASWILASEGLEQDHIKNLLYKKRTNTVYLSDTVPVHIQYSTAFIDQEQHLNFRNDIYQRDKIVYQALQNPAQPRVAQLVAR